MFETSFSIDEIKFKNIDFKGVNLEIFLKVKNNFFMDIELNDIYISLYKECIKSGDKIGEGRLQKNYCLCANDEHQVKLDIKVYYSGIMINAIPALIKKGFLCALDIDIYFKVAFFKGHKNIVETKFFSL